jgi:hypothetical protein
MSFIRPGLLVCAAWLLVQTATAAELPYLQLPKNNWEDKDVQPWTEESVPPPAFPQEANLMPFYVSEMTAHRFFIDGATLAVGKDGVVRYVLVVRTSGGATNISFEGMHCERLEYKIYASGRQDGTWTPTRKPEWRPIENKPVNRYHAALSRDYFCPIRTPIQTPEEGRDALRLGKHPNAK